MGKTSELGQRIQLFRKRKRMTQYQLASLSNVSRSAIAGIESGDRPALSLHNTVKIADALGVSIDLLVRNDPVEKKK